MDKVIEVENTGAKSLLRMAFKSFRSPLFWLGLILASYLITRLPSEPGEPGQLFELLFLALGIGFLFQAAALYHLVLIAFPTHKYPTWFLTQPLGDRELTKILWIPTCLSAIPIMLIAFSPLLTKLSLLEYGLAVMVSIQITTFVYIAFFMISRFLQTLFYHPGIIVSYLIALGVSVLAGFYVKGSPLKLILFTTLTITQLWLSKILIYTHLVEIRHNRNSSHNQNHLSTLWFAIIQGIQKPRQWIPLPNRRFSKGANFTWLLQDRKTMFNLLIFHVLFAVIWFGGALLEYMDLRQEYLLSTGIIPLVTILSYFLYMTISSSSTQWKKLLPLSNEDYFKAKARLFYGVFIVMLLIYWGILLVCRLRNLSFDGPGELTPEFLYSGFVISLILNIPMFIMAFPLDYLRLNKPINRFVSRQKNLYGTLFAIILWISICYGILSILGAVFYVSLYILAAIYISLQISMLLKGIQLKIITKKHLLLALLTSILITCLFIFDSHEEVFDLYRNHSIMVWIVSCVLALLSGCSYCNLRVSAFAWRLLETPTPSEEKTQSTLIRSLFRRKTV